MFTFIIGMQWGDEGKGKFADYFAKNCRNVVRYNGGNNSGHTIIKDGRKLVTHILPSGVMHKGVKNHIVMGTVLDPFVLVDEIIKAREIGCVINSSEELAISENIPLILPYHIEIDKVRESRLSNGKLGTTNKGIGPAYEDFFGRRSVFVKDLFNDEDLLFSKLNKILPESRLIINDFSAWFGKSTLIENLIKIGKILQPFVVPNSGIFDDNSNYIMEGAQAVMLDVIHGDYPFVTSSSVLPEWFFLHYPEIRNKMWNVAGVFKAYATRVGSGPFPTQMDEKSQDTIREIGKEYGATTGRPRNCGWLDLVQMKKAIAISHPDQLIMTKSDVLGMLGEVKVACDENPEGDISYKIFSGWGNLQNCKSPIDFPGEFKKFIAFIERELETRIKIISTGPEREQIIHQ